MHQEGLLLSTAYKLRRISRPSDLVFSFGLRLNLADNATAFGLALVDAEVLQTRQCRELHIERSGELHSRVWTRRTCFFSTLDMWHLSTPLSTEGACLPNRVNPTSE
jgi:hypothetical protein